MFISFYTVFQFPFAEETILVTLFILMILDFYFLFKSRRSKKINEQHKKKVFLLESMIKDTRNGLSGMMLINIFNFINFSDVIFIELAVYWQIAIAFITTLICIVFYITAFVMPSKAEELLLETYPEYKFLFF